MARLKRDYNPRLEQFCRELLEAARNKPVQPDVGFLFGNSGGMMRRIGFGQQRGDVT